MTTTLAVKNVKCGGCANTLTKGLRENFGEVSVDLDKHPREITLDIEPEQMEALKLQLRKMGYPLLDDELSSVQEVTTKAKSFVSCAVGKMDS